MSEETKTCPYCAEEIKTAAIVCKHCGRSLDGEPEPLPAPATATPAPTAEEKKNPKIGLAGILIMFIAAPLMCAISGAIGGSNTGMNVGIIVGVVGLIILVYAIMSGNIKTFG